MEGTLYEITERYRTVLSMMEDDEEDECLKDTLDSIVGEFEEKADNIVAIIKALELQKGSISGQRQVFEKEVETLKEKETSIDNHIAWLKKYLCNAMIAVDKPKFKTNRFSFWTQKTSAVVIDNESEVPLDFMTTPKPEISKKLIKEALSKGEKLSFAHMEENESVRFR